MRDCLAKVGVAGSNPVVRSKESQVKGYGRRARRLPCPRRAADVPHLPSLERLGDFLVGPIEPSRVVLFDHPRGCVAKPERHEGRVRAGLQSRRPARITGARGIRAAAAELVQSSIPTLQVRNVLLRGDEVKLWKVTDIAEFLGVSTR